jgi:hypothetical protein
MRRQALGGACTQVYNRIYNRKSPGQGTGARRRFTLLHPSKNQLLEPPRNRARTTFFAGLPPTWGFSLSTGCERVVGGVFLRGDLGGLRLAFDGAGEGFLGGTIVEILDLLVVAGASASDEFKALVSALPA